MLDNVVMEAAARDAGIGRAARALGGAAKLAEVAGVTTSAVYQWLSGERPVPAERAPIIANASGVPVEDICPGVPWHLAIPRSHVDA